MIQKKTQSKNLMPTSIQQALKKLNYISNVTLPTRIQQQLCYADLYPCFVHDFKVHWWGIYVPLQSLMSDNQPKVSSKMLVVTATPTVLKQKQLCVCRQQRLTAVQFKTEKTSHDLAFAGKYLHVWELKLNRKRLPEWVCGWLTPLDS